MEGAVEDAISVTPLAHELNATLKRFGLPHAEDERSDKKRSVHPLLFSKGGEVFGVPNVPKYPHKRKDKTSPEGESYDKRAGGAFVDDETDPLRRLFGQRSSSDLSVATGGKILRSIKRQRKSFVIGSFAAKLASRGAGRRGASSLTKAEIKDSYYHGLLKKEEFENLMSKEASKAAKKETEVPKISKGSDRFKLEGKAYTNKDFKETRNQLAGDLEESGIYTDPIGYVHELDLTPETYKRMAPESARIIKALEGDDWLGFERIDDALLATFDENINKWGPSLKLKQALGRYMNQFYGGYTTARPKIPKEDLIPQTTAAGKTIVGAFRTKDEIIVDQEAKKIWKQRPENVGTKQKHIPEVKEAAIKLRNNEINEVEYDKIVRKYQPVTPSKEVLRPPTKEDIKFSLNKKKIESGIIGENVFIEDGTLTSSRLDIPAYEGSNTWVVTLHDSISQKVLGYGQTAVLNNVTFGFAPKASLNVATATKVKTPFAKINGAWENVEPEEAYRMASKLINDEEWTQVGFNPYRHGFFYDEKTMNPVISAEKVIQVGKLVLAKNVKKASRTDKMFSIDPKNPRAVRFATGGVGGTYKLGNVL